MMRLTARLFAAALVTAVAVPAAAQQIAIVGGTVHTAGPQGTIENGTVLIREGRIEAVGQGSSIPPGYERIDAGGKVVTPGIFAPFTRLGLVEISLEEATRDDRVEGLPFAAAFDVSYGVNPRATTLPVTRIEGVTRAAVTPVSGDNIFAGFGALIHTGEADDTVFMPRAFMAASLGEDASEHAGSARSAGMVYFRQALEDAERYAGLRNKDDWDGLVSAMDAQALGPVVRGEVPVLIRADRASDLTQIVALKRERSDLDITVVGAAEGWLVADDLAAAGIAVIVHPFANLPGSFDMLAATQENAKRLHEAGVTIAIGDPNADGHNPRLILQYAGNAVANDLDWQAALRAVTLAPAQIFGVGDRLGSLERGKIGDVVVWDGDPFEVTSSPDAVIIAGEPTPLVSRQTKLRDRYMRLDRDRPHSYVR